MNNHKLQNLSTISDKLEVFSFEKMKADFISIIDELLKTFEK
jgi:hypothetical protein